MQNDDFKNIKCVGMEDVADVAHIDQAMAHTRTMIMETDPDEIMELVDKMSALCNQIKARGVRNADREYFTVRGDVGYFMWHLAWYGWNRMMAEEVEARKEGKQ